ncbi:MAG: GntR family transcriptional regulator [Pseudomonadota bacterium]|nr:GntR family transcriptional regulator [Pseudomonadota bacterium]
MKNPNETKEFSIPVHETVYRNLRAEILVGSIKPGEVLTLRGLAKRFAVSVMPVRESVRRLTAEGALSISPSGRIFTPKLTNERIEELASVRALLEPELASKALPRVHNALIDRLVLINSTIDQMIAKKDANGYVRSNLEFHRTLYLRAQAPSTLALVETVWLQFVPTMRALYDEIPRNQAPNYHRKILSTLRVGDEPGLRLAVRADVTNGLRMLLLT